MAEFSLSAGKDFLNPVVINRYLRKPMLERVSYWVKGALMAGCVIVLTTGLTLGGKILLDSKAHLADRKLILLKSASQLAAEPSARNKRSKASLDVISSRNIFGPLQPARLTSNAQTTQPKPKTPLTLIGTFVAGPKENHYAIIEDPKRSLQDVFSYGDVVFGDATVEGITADEVKIKHSNGEIETLVLDDAPISSGSSSGSTGAPVEQIAVDKAELDESLANLPLLLTQARAVPYFKDGKPVGLRLFAIKSASMFEKIGLKNGDILKTINGTSMTDITQAVKLFEQLRSERSISVLVERNREERELQYQIR